MKRENKNVVLSLVCMLAALSVIATCSFVGCGSKKTDTVDTEAVTEAAETGDETEETTRSEYTDEELFGEGVTTQTNENPYIQFNYPTDWDDDFTVTEGKTDDGAYNILFKGTEADSLADVTIFGIRFGTTASGDYYELGSITVDGETVNVYFMVNTEISEYTEEQQTRIMELQSCVNEILAQLQDSSDFVSTHG